MKRCIFILTAALLFLTSCHDVEVVTPAEVESTPKADSIVSSPVQSYNESDPSSETEEEQERLHRISFDDIDQNGYLEEFPPAEEYMRFLERHADYHQVSITGEMELWKRGMFTQLIACRVELDSNTAVYWGVNRYDGRIYQWELEEEPEDLGQLIEIENLQVIDSYNAALDYINDMVFSDMVTSYGERTLFEKDDQCNEYDYRYESQPQQLSDGRMSFCRLGISIGDNSYLVRGSILNYSDTDTGAEGTLCWCFVNKNGLIVHENKRVWIVQAFE